MDSPSKTFGEGVADAVPETSTLYTRRDSAVTTVLPPTRAHTDAQAAQVGTTRGGAALTVPPHLTHHFGAASTVPSRQTCRVGAVNTVTPNRVGVRQTMPPTRTHDADAAVPSNTLHRDDAVLTVPSLHSHIGTAQTLPLHDTHSGSDTPPDTIQRGGAVSTVPSRSKQPAQAGRAAGKLAALEAQALATSASSAQAQGRTQPHSETGETLEVVPVTEKSVAPEHTPAVEPTFAWLANWTLPQSSNRKRKLHADGTLKVQKNKKQRRKSRERRAALLQQTNPVLKQLGAPKEAVVGSPADHASSEKGKNNPSKESRLTTTVATKRCLDDTPRVEPKRTRLESIETPRVATGSYEDALKANLPVAITSSSGHLGPQLSEEVINQLQALITKEAVDPSNSQSQGPAFRGKPVITNNVLKLWCEDQTILQWLKRSLATITLSTGESVCLERKRVRCGILLPVTGIDFGTVARVLRYQNQWADVDNWLFYKLEMQKTESFAVVSIPQMVLPILVQRGRRLNFFLGSVYVKFQGARGKYLEELPSSLENPSCRDTVLSDSSVQSVQTAQFMDRETEASAVTEMSAF